MPKEFVSGTRSAKLLWVEYLSSPEFSRFCTKQCSLKRSDEKGCGHRIRSSNTTGTWYIKKIFMILTLSLADTTRRAALVEAVVRGRMRYHVSPR